MSVSTLRLWIDKLNLWDTEPHIPLERLASYFAQHIYMPTLATPSVLTTTVKERPDSTLALNDGFAYATGIDDSRYVGLTMGEVTQVSGSGLIVDPTIARAQLEREATPEPPTPGDPAASSTAAHPIAPAGTPVPTAPGSADFFFPSSSNRLYAEFDVPLDRSVKVASDLAQEVLRHLSANGVTVKVRFDIEAEGTDKIEATLLADILNNLRTIGFTVDTQ